MYILICIYNAYVITFLFTLGGRSLNVCTERRERLRKLALETIDLSKELKKSFIQNVYVKNN